MSSPSSCPRIHTLLLAAALGLLAPLALTGCGKYFDPPRAEAQDLTNRYALMVTRTKPFGPGGKQVLEVAWKTLRNGQADGKWLRVGLEDLWTHALQEGGALMWKPERLWGPTGPEETKDLLGQTTVGPWQLTIENIQKRFGADYGIDPTWTPAQVAEFVRARPEIQAAMICDLIEANYNIYGRRAPYAIQSYFWLEAFARGWIGQGSWDTSVLPPTNPDGTPPTEEQKRQTGFYAKQVLLGHKYNPNGLVYWLWATGDTEAIREVFTTWREEPTREWNERKQLAVEKGKPGAFAIAEDDLKYLQKDAEAYAAVLAILKEVNAQAAAK